MNPVYSSPVLTHRVTLSWRELQKIAAAGGADDPAGMPEQRLVGPGAGSEVPAGQAPSREAGIAVKSLSSALKGGDTDALVAELARKITPMIAEQLAGQIDIVLDVQLKSAIGRIKNDIQKSIGVTVQNVIRQALKDGRED